MRNDIGDYRNDPFRSSDAERFVPGFRTTSGPTLGMDFPIMPYNPRILPRQRITLGAELLERRSLLSGAAPGHQDVAIQVPSAYVSQQSSQLDVTLVRTTPSGHKDYSKGSITVDFSATSVPTGGTASASDAPAQQFTAVNQSVTFPAGKSTETVAVPINSGAPNPGLVPIQLAVTSSARQVKGSSTTVSLASSAAAIPPSIIGVQRVAGGIAITFSKPMDPATVANIHNYVVKFSPKDNFSLENLYGVGLVQALDNTPVKISLRRATYNPATNTVLLVATEQLGPNGAYTISSPASLLAKKPKPSNAHPLTDVEGNVLNQGKTDGAFSITIGKGKPFAAVAPTLAVET
jgi:hypothetical protein